MKSSSAVLVWSFLRIALANPSEAGGAPAGLAPELVKALGALGLTFAQYAQFVETDELPVSYVFPRSLIAEGRNERRGHSKRTAPLPTASVGGRQLAFL